MDRGNLGNGACRPLKRKSSSSRNGRRKSRVCIQKSLNRRVHRLADPECALIQSVHSKNPYKIKSMQSVL